MQNLVLGLGALVMAVAVGLVPFIYTGVGGGLKAIILIVLTLAAVVAPIVIARRGLVTTAEWITPLGLLLILLDGKELWSGQLTHSGLSPTLYAGLVCAIAAGLAVGYQRFSNLAVPRFSAIVLIQPIPVLLAYPLLKDLSAWASVIIAMAAIDLIIALRSRRTVTHGRYLRASVRWLQELVTLAGLVCGSIALAQAHTTMGSVRAGATVIAAAVVGLAAGLLFRDPPLPDISSGIATLALIAGFGKMGSLALPGWGLLATSIAIAASALGIRLLPAYARRGAQIAGSAAALATAIVVVVRGWDALGTPLRAALPVWQADLTAYDRTVALHSGHSVGQLVLATLLLAVAAAVMLPVAWRRDGVLVGVALTTIIAPGAWHLPWGVAIVSCAVISLAMGVVGLAARTDRESWVAIGCALLVGGYGTGLAVARPGAQALLLLVFAIGGAAIGAAGTWPGRAAVVPSASRSTASSSLVDLLRGGLPEHPNVRVAEAAWGGAAFAFPGAIAAATAALRPNGLANPTAILAASFVAVAGTLSAVAVSQVARGRQSPMLVGGATLGALAVALAAVRTQGVATSDVVVAVVLLLSAGLLCVAPMMRVGFRPGLWSISGTPLPNRNTPATAGRHLLGLDGNEIAAAAVTAASIAALSRVASLVVAGSGLVIMAAFVLLVAAGTRAMPVEWRRGPIVGGGLVGVGVGAGAGYAAVIAGYDVVRVNHPLWNVSLVDWADRLARIATPAAHSPATPLALLLLAAAAAIVLPRYPAQIACGVAIGLTALALPATLGTGWWGPSLFSGVVSTATGILAASTRNRNAAMATAGVTVVLFVDTVAASLVRPATTAGTLVASTLVCVAMVAASARTSHAMSGLPARETNHLVLIGGGSLGAAFLTLAAAAGTAAAATGAPLSLILTSALAALSLGLALTGLAARWIEPLLARATGAISLGGLGIALAYVQHLSTAGVYAAVAALLAVLAELLRAAVIARRGSRTASSAGGWLPRRTTVLLAAGPATGLAIASVAPTVLAALVGPYRWVGSIWAGAPASSVAELGRAESLVGHPIGVVTAVLVTVTLLLGAVGFGGTSHAIIGRAVAVVTPGVAITLLIAPFLLHSEWPAGPAAAIAVGAISGLALALSTEPPNTDAASALRSARQLVVVICVLSSGAGIAGSLATSSTTVGALAIATGTGLVAALYGQRQAARVTGWIVTALAAEALALVIGLILGLSPHMSAFVVGGVAAALLMTASLLPRLRRAPNSTETITVEVSAYAGAVLGLVLAARSIPHLAVFFGAWGAVLGIAAGRAQRSRLYRGILMWTAAGHELVAWCLLMAFSHVAVPEAYTLGIAIVALITGWIELRWHPRLTSWVSYGVALTAALGPSLAVAIATGETPLRRVLLLIGAAAITIGGALRRQQAPVIVGGIALLGAVGNEIARYSTTALMLVLMALISAALISVGANYEKRRRNVARVRDMFNRMQ